MPTETTINELRRYAILGAEARLLAIAEEAAAIYRVFPELRERNRQRHPGWQNFKTTKTKSCPRASAKHRAAQPNVRRPAKSGWRADEEVYWAVRRGEKKESQKAEGNATQRPAESNAIAAPHVRKAATQPSRAPKTSSRRRRGRRGMSAAARKRISEAQKARWAKRKRGRATVE